jgi:hypothetical protein
MAKLFIGLALLCMLATAGLGFLAKGNVDKLISTVKEKTIEVDKKTGEARTALKEKEKAEEELKVATVKAEEATKASELKDGELQKANVQIAEAKATIDAKTKEITDLNTKIAGMPTSPTAPVGDDPRVAALTAELQKSQADLAEIRQVAEITANRAKDTEAKLAAAEQKQKIREQQLGVAGLQGRILAVNSGWNFVVLSVGDKQGVAVNAPLLVVRGGEPIARLRISSVEPSTSIADVIPGTVRRGATVQPGDTVIFEGRKGAPNQPANGGNVEAAEPAPLPN